MKTIKFRMWIDFGLKTSKNYMLYGPIDFNKNLIIDTGLGISYPIEELKIMQYTGCKDENGKEIYEGDIIDGRYGKQTVEFSHSYCGFVPFCYSSNTPNAEESKVIGNIYEDKK